MLSGCEARKFRLLILNISSAGGVSWNAAGDAAGDVTGGAAVDAAWDATFYFTPGDEEWYSARYNAWSVAMHTAGHAASTAAVEARKKRGTLQQIADVACRSVISDRKKIIEEIDKLCEQIPSTPMSPKEVADICTTMMTFDDLTKLQSTLPLKMVDYLLGYEQAINFLPCAERKKLMNKHQDLLNRLDLEKSYAGLKEPECKVSRLSDYLPMLPLVIVELIVGYCALGVSDPDDLNEIYRRLLIFEEFQVVE